MTTLISSQLLADMNLFVLVGRLLSFQAAAKQLDLSASTLSRRIAALEKSIGLRLLNRTTRHVALTNDGRAYFERCQDILLAAQVAHQQLHDSTHALSGTLRFSCTPDFANFYLADLLVQFNHHYPHIRLEMELSSRHVDLMTENFDCALRIGDVQDSTLVAKPLVRLFAGLYASPQYLQAQGTPQTPADLANHRLLPMSAQHGQSRWTLQHPSSPAYSIAFSAPMVCNSPMLLRNLALQHMGIAYIDSIMVRQDIAQGRLVRILPDWHSRSMSVTMLTTSRLQPARVRVFGDFLRSTLLAQTHSG